MSVYRLLDALHEAMQALDISDNDRHFLMEWIRDEIRRRDLITAVAVCVAFALGFGTGAWFYC